MRISDWSSDVCSSDLHSRAGRAVRRRPRRAHLLCRGAVAGRPGRKQPGRSWQVLRSPESADPEGFARNLVRPQSPRRSAADRKSVVSGKSVSVRVDLGGRRIIKKKKTKTPQKK